MKKNVLEALESRLFFDVTLTNGLNPSVDGYYSAVVSDGGQLLPGSVFFTGASGTPTSVMFEYYGYFDTGVLNPPARATDFSRVVRLGTVTNFVTASDSVLVGDAAVSTGVITIPDADDYGPNPDATNNRRINYTVTTTIPAGEARLVSKYEFTSVNGFDLQGAKFYQYMDSDVAPNVGDDVFKVSGATARGLELASIDSISGINMTQSGNDARGADLAGWEADAYPQLRNRIEAGTVQAPQGGLIDTVDLPPGTFDEIGPAFGPNDVTSVLRYDFSATGAASVTTNLGTFVGQVTTPIIQVLGRDRTNAQVIIQNGDTTPSADEGTDFGNGLVPQTNFFTIRNFGIGTLSLNSLTRVQITGENASEFSVAVQPTELVASGLSSNFQILFLPTSAGTKSATVVINSNDPAATPFTFEIKGGSGVNIAPDAFEDDNTIGQANFISTNGVQQSHSINSNTDVDWVTFNITETANVVVDTNGEIGDTVMQLYGPDDSKTSFATVDNGGNREFARYTGTLTPGQYWARVSENGSNARIPAYTISVLATPLTPFAVVDSSGTLVVTGTALSDSISVDLAPGNIKVTRNDETLFFTATSVLGLTINAGDGDDLVQIGFGVTAARIDGGNGSDFIVGGDFGDTILGGEGNDSIYGAAGRDVLYGQNGDDKLFGQLATDTLYGGAGDDVLQGGKGDDSLLGEAGSDALFGLLGNDYLGGGKGSDSLDGGDGNDILVGGLGADDLRGGADDDVFFARDGEVDTLDGSVGNNSAQVDGGTVADELASIQNLLA